MIVAQNSGKELGPMERLVQRSPGDQDAVQEVLTEIYSGQKLTENMSSKSVKPTKMRTETRNITNERTKTKTETSKLMIKYDKNDG